MKKKLVRTCASVLAALMLVETAFTGSFSASVYADELDEIVVAESEVLEEEATEEAQTLSTEEEIVTEEEVVAEEAANVPVHLCPKYYFDTKGGSLAKDASRLVDARIEVDVIDGEGTTIGEAIGQVLCISSDETLLVDGEGKIDENGLLVPVREGYTFIKWIDELGNDINLSQVVTAEDKHFTAVWEAKKSVLNLEIKIVDEPDEIHETDMIEIVSDEPGATIYYNLTNTPATTSDTKYRGQLSLRDLIDNKVTSNTIVYLQAVAVKEGADPVRASRVITIKPDWGDVPDAVRITRFSNDITNVPSGIWFTNIEESVGYTGKAITFKDIKVFNGTKLLEEKKDYTLSYVNNTATYEYVEGSKSFSDAKAPAIVVTGKGNYAGVYKKYFVINKINIADAVFDELSAKYNGAVQQLVPTGNYKGKTIKAGTDFKVTYPVKDAGAYKNKGYHDVTITGIGNFKGTTTIKEHISEELITGATVYGVIDLPYNTNPATRYWEHKAVGAPDFQVFLSKSNILVEGYDYEVIYDEYAPEVGSTYLRIVGLGTKYSGQIKVPYKIVEPEGYGMVNISNCYFSGLKPKYAYDTKPCDQSGYIEVRTSLNSSTKLTFGKDYSITVKEIDGVADNVNVGKVTLILEGIYPYYYGRKEFTFEITPRDISKWGEDHITIDNDATLVNGIAEPNIQIEYNGKILEEDKDYELSYVNNTHTFSTTEMSTAKDNSIKPAVVIKGKGNYKGTVKQYFTITGNNFSGVRVVPSDKVYAEKENNYIPSIKITDAKGKVLTADKDYKNEFKYYYVDETILDNGTVHKGETLNSDGTITYGDEVQKGETVPVDTCIRVEATPIGDYGNIITHDSQGQPIYKTISATYRVVGNNIANATVTIPTQYYDGEEVTLDRNQIVVTYKSRLLNENEYEIVGYENNNKVGTGKVTIKGIGEFGGTKTITFTIAAGALGSTVIFNPNGATSGTMANQAVKSYGTTTKPEKLVKNAFKRTYYTFAGWNTEADGSGYTIVNNATLTSMKGLLTTGEALILYAMWAPVTYKIYVHNNGGTFDESIMPSTYTADNPTYVLPVPDSSTWPKGYMFAGWYKDEALISRVYQLNNGTAGELNLYAKWVPYTFKIRYEMNYTSSTNLTKMADTVVSYGEEKALSANKFSRKDYSFAGWSMSSTATKPDFKNEQKVSNKSFGIKETNNIDEEVILYAVWLKEYDIDFEPNGGEVFDSVGNVITSMTYTYGKATKLPTPVREGYTFGGWYTDDVTFKTKIASITSSMATDYTLYAKWIANTYTISFNKNPSTGVSGSMSALTMTYDVSKNLPANKFVRKGWKFIGWSEEPTGSVVWVDGEEVDVNLASKKGAKVTLYAQWETTDYTISFHANDGTIDDSETVLPDYNYYYGSEFALPSISRTGYVFAGWYKEPTLKTKITKIKKSTAEDLDLYAKWTADKAYRYAGRKYYINVMNESDFTWTGAPIPEYYTYGSTYTFPSGIYAPKKEGYKFVGWYTNPGMTSKITAIKATTYDDLRLYAKFTPDTYTITFNVNKPAAADAKTVTGKTTTQTKIKYGVATAIKKNAFKIKGYTFTGWNTEEDGSGESYVDAEKIVGAKNGSGTDFDSITLYAQWSLDSYTITYKNVTGYNPNYGSYNVNSATFTLNDTVQIGKTFLGWYSDAGFKTRVKKIEKGSTGNKTLYAKWANNYYNITYKLNANDDPYAILKSGLVGYITNYFKREGGSYVLASAERLGYDFKGWSTSASGTSPVYALKETPTSNKTFYAVWEAKKYKLEYNYGYAGKKVEETYTISKEPQKLKIPVRFGYKLNGWHVGSETGPLTMGIAPNQIGDMKLYADWNPVEYTIVFTLPGSDKPAPETIYMVGDMEKPLPIAPKIQGRTFIAWKIKGSDGKKLYYAGDEVSAKDFYVVSNTIIQLEAVWSYE